MIYLILFALNLALLGLNNRAQFDRYGFDWRVHFDGRGVNSLRQSAQFLLMIAGLTLQFSQHWSGAAALLSLAILVGIASLADYLLRWPPQITILEVWIVVFAIFVWYAALGLLAHIIPSGSLRHRIYHRIDTTPDSDYAGYE